MPSSDPELRALFLAQCATLARLTAALGIPGDEPADKLVPLARELRRDAEAMRKFRTGFRSEPELHP